MEEVKKQIDALSNKLKLLTDAQTKMAEEE